MHHNSILRSAGYCLSTAVLLAVAVASAWAGPADPVNPLTKRFVQGKPLDICDEGALFIGGVPKVTNYLNSATAAGNPDQIIIGKMYVQFQIPTKHRQWPLIVVHGSGYTGSCLDATPDGREGWLPYALQNNISVFVVDQAGRGRSGFDQSVLHEARVTNNLNLIPTIGGGGSSVWTSWWGHLIPAGSTILNGTLIRHGDPGDPDPSSPEPSQAHGVYPPAYPIPPVNSSIDPKIQARVGAIGAVPNPVNNTYLALNSYSYLVPNTESTLPPSVCAACTPTTVSAANTWTPRALAELVERLGGAIVAGHSQASSEVLHMVRILKEDGKLDLLKGIYFPEGAADLAGAGLKGSDFDHVPFLVVNGDYRANSIRATDYAARDAINASPTHAVAPATVIDLDDPSFKGQFNGTSHMNMLGTNNLAVFDVIQKWFDQNVPNPIAATSCPSGNGQGNNGQGQNSQH
jgi:hypothetical protein